MKAPALTPAEHIARQLHSQKEALRSEKNQLRKDLESCEFAKIKVIHRHGEANTLLEKFTRKWIVRVFCPSLRKEALAHVNQR